MLWRMKHFILLISLLFVFSCLAQDASTSQYKRAEIKTCSGCQLNRYPSLKKWVYNEAPKYAPELTVIFSGGDPRLYFLDDNNKVVETIFLAGKEPQAVEALLNERGFMKKDSKNEL